MRICNFSKIHQQNKNNEYFCKTLYIFKNGEMARNKIEHVREQIFNFDFYLKEK